MHRKPFAAAKIAAAAACLAVGVAVAAPATAAAATLAGTHAPQTSYAVYFLGSGVNVQQATANAEGQAAQDGYWSCAIVSVSESPGIWGPTYSVWVGCNVF